MTQGIDFSLSLKSIKNIHFDNYEQNFTFTVNGKQYKTNRVLADLLSPIIREYHYQDSTANEFVIDTKSTEDDFTDFLKLFQSEKVHIDDKRWKSYIQYFYQLGNFDECLSLQQQYFEGLNPENVIDRLNILVSITEDCKSTYNKNTEARKSIDIHGKIHQLIDYASSHFDQIDKEKVRNLSPELFEGIIQSDSLRLESEDSLLELVISKYEEDPEKFGHFFENIKFENLTEESIEKFIGVFRIDNISTQIWRNICCLLLPNKMKGDSFDRYNMAIVEKGYVVGKDFNGILKFLRDETGGNIHKNGTVNITDNSVYKRHDENRQPENITDPELGSYEMPSIENSMVCFDFKERRIQLNAYSVMTYSYQKGARHLKSWVVEVSNDENNWEIVDEHKDDETLNDEDASSTFRTKKSEGFYRFVRIRQTGKNWFNNYGTYIRLIEFYGKITQNNPK